MKTKPIMIAVYDENDMCVASFKGYREFAEATGKTMDNVYFLVKVLTEGKHKTFSFNGKKCTLYVFEDKDD